VRIFGNGPHRHWIIFLELISKKVYTSTPTIDLPARATPF
jgi:hypothetical protein